MDRAREVLDAVDGNWVADQAEKLVRIPSETLDEAAACRCYVSQLEALGLAVDVREVSPERSNLYACIPGQGGGPALMLNGHLDTIPIGKCPPPERTDERICGRGTTDMKGGMAAMLGAVRAIQTAGARLQGDLWLTAVVGHEEPEAEKDGPKALIQDLNEGRVWADRILIAEGRDALWIMSMGSMVFCIRLTSKRGGTHTQYVPFAENPVRHLGDLIGGLKGFQEELDAGPAHRLAGPERIDVGIVNAGDYFNRIPPECALTGTRRWAPGKSAEEVLAELDAICRLFAASGGLDLKVEMVHEREPFETPADDPAVDATRKAHLTVTGQEAENVGMRIVGDANLYVHGTGIPTYYYGPSNETAHSDQEWVSIRRMEEAAKVYALTAVAYCGTGQSE